MTIIDIDRDLRNATWIRSLAAPDDNLTAAGNPWHDEIGQFAPKGTGTNFANIARRADQAERAGSQITELDLEQAATLTKRLDEFTTEMGFEFAADDGVKLTRHALNQRHGRGEMRGFAATDPDGVVLGAIAYTTTDRTRPPTTHIEFLGSTGLVKGVGSQLTIPVMEQAAAAGAKVTLKVAGTKSAASFWESLGFERDWEGATGATMQPDEVQAWVENLNREREGVLVGAGPAAEGWDPDDDRWAAHAIELGLMNPPTIVAAGNPWHDEVGRFAPKGSGTNWDALGRTGPFDTAQMAEWEEVKPWNLTKEEAIAQRVPGFWHQERRGTETASWDGRYIRTTDDFYALPENVRRAVAYHEAGHAMLEAAGGGPSIPEFMDLIDMPGGKSLSYNGEEIIAEAYSVLWDEPEWFDRMGAHQIRDITIAAAKRAGYPLPDDNLTASVSQFANPWHDEIGRFAPKGTGTMSRNVTDDFAEPPPGYIPESQAEWRAGYAYLQDHEMPEWWTGTEFMDEDGLPKPNEVAFNWNHEGINDEIDAWNAEVGEDVARGVWSIGRQAEQRRRYAILQAISTNQIDLEAAEERWGKYRSEPYSGGTWQDLPPVLYHATSALSAIAESGRLMTRDEIGGRKNAAGLGGGSDDTISFTSDKAVAEGIVRSLHEVRRAITTDNDSLRNELKDRAGPWWPQVVESYRSIHGMTDGQTESVEDRYNLYRVYSAYREQHTGVLDPLFFNVDPNRLAMMNPDDIGIVAVKPAMPGARGYQVSALGEWRTPTGAATQIVNTERLDDRGGFTIVHRMAFANPWHDEVGKFAPKGTGRKVTAVEEALSSPGAGTVGAVDMWAAGQARQGISALRNAIIKAREAARGFDTVPDNVLAAVADEHGLTGAEANLVAGSLMYRAGIAALSLQRLTDKADELGVDPAELERKLVSNAQRFVDEGTLSLRMDSDTLDTILNGDGEIKSQFETATSKGAYDPALRAVAEASHFGLDPNSDPHDRPVYGYLVPPTGDTLPAGSYGNVRLVMKDDVRDRTTATFSDSLGSEVRPAYLNQIDLGAVAPSMYTDYDNPGRGVMFVEAQIHGDTRIDDVAEAHFDYPPDEALKSRLEERGIKVVGPPSRTAAARRVMEFANPWHDEIGRFAPKGTGSRSGEIVMHLDAVEADAEFEEKYGNERRSGDGDCFEVGLHYIHNIPPEEEHRYKLCHGVPEGQGPIEGVRFDHCWIERTDPLPETMTPEQREMFEQYEMNITVIDKSNGNDVEMPRLLYYQIGNIKPRDVRRYTPDEARREAIRTGVYGPWT